MSRKLLVMLSIVALFTVGAFAVFAQDGNDPTPPFGPGGRGMMGRQFGYGEPMYERVAEALGLEVDAFISALQSGKTVAELAAEQGVDLDTVSAAITAQATEHLNAMVAAGYLTQEQADAHLATMTANLEAHLNGGLMFGSGMGFGRGGCPMWDDAPRGNMRGGRGRRWGGA